MLLHTLCYAQAMFSQGLLWLVSELCMCIHTYVHMCVYIFCACDVCVVRLWYVMCVRYICDVLFVCMCVRCCVGVCVRWCVGVNGVCVCVRWCALHIRLLAYGQRMAVCWANWWATPTVSTLFPFSRPGVRLSPARGTGALCTFVFSCGFGACVRSHT